MPLPESPDAVIDELSQELDAISGRLVAARANAEALPDFPGQLPQTLDDAYTIQSASIARWPDEIAGWKVGMVPESYRERLAAERLTGPIFKSSVFRIKPGSTKTMPIYTGGFAALEAEFVFELAVAIEPSERDYSDEELIERVAGLFIGAEVASSPMALINELGPCAVVSDFGNNAGLIVGPSIPNWSSMPLDSLTVGVTIDDKIVGKSDANAIEGGPLRALRFLFHSCGRRGLDLPRGTLISTGAVTGIHDVQVGSKADIDFGSFGSFKVAFESMTRKN